MRIYIHTTPSTSIVPFNYQPALTGALHKWMGHNQVHDNVSLYSFSWLNGGRALKNGIDFNNGSNFFISTHDNELLKCIIKGIQIDPEINFGLTVKEIQVCDAPKFNQNKVLFYTGSPVLIKKTVNDRVHHFTYKEEECSEHLTNMLKLKLRIAGLSDDQVNIEFDRSYPKAKTKVIYYNSIGNCVNLCPIIINGTHEQLAFAWNVGVGNSTGIGFGALK